MDNSPASLDNPVPDADAGDSAGRLYSGLKSSERAKERHCRLVAAGFDVFGTVGYANAKINTLCKSAGLSQRYFYESFDSREQLLTTIYDGLSDRLMAEVVNAVTAPGIGLLDAVRAGMAAVVHFMLDDPRNAQIILVEIVGVSPELEAKRHASMESFAMQSMRLLLLLGGIDPAGLADGEEEEATMNFARLTAISMVGGVNNVLLDAILSRETDEQELIIEVAYRLICNAANGIRAVPAAG